MKHIALFLGIFFMILTFIGGGYVIANQGAVNAGYAVIPSLWAILFLGYYRKKKEE